MDVSNVDLSKKGDSFTLAEGEHTHTFEWLAFDRLQDEYFYPIFLKEQIFDLPKEFTIRTEWERHLVTQKVLPVF